MKPEKSLSVSVATIDGLTRVVTRANLNLVVVQHWICKGIELICGQAVVGRGECPVAHVGKELLHIDGHVSLDRNSTSTAGIERSRNVAVQLDGERDGNTLGDL